MDREGFRRLLQERKTPEELIAGQIAMAERFEQWLEERDARRQPTGDDVRDFSALLIKEGRNTYENYLALVRYGHFVGSHPVYIAAVELIDGSEALDGLYTKLGQWVNPETRDKVFAGIDLPPLGTPPASKPPVTQAVMERLEELVDPDTCREILSGGLRDMEDAWFIGERTKYLECGSLDLYLERKGQDFIAQLEQLRDDGGLFFTQPVTDRVIEFVRANPEIAQGVREGNILYEVKIPYMAEQYLTAADDRLKRYYYCHCPWVRESLRTDNLDVSPTFCLCSAGFHKKSWEVILDQPLRADIVETVLNGDRWCKIAIHLPESVQAS